MVPKGGKRKGAGRPPGSGKFGEPTKAIRIPARLTKLVQHWVAETNTFATQPTIKNIPANQKISPSITNASLPLYGSAIQAGFPTFTDDYVESTLSINDYLIKNPVSTFLVRVAGQSMENAGIYEGDILVVDRSKEAIDGKIIIAAVDGELTVKRLKKRNGKLFLCPENKSYPELEIKNHNELKAWGVVTGIVRKI